MQEEVDEPDVMTFTSLRGPSYEDGHRSLLANFQIKMYWESDYCVSKVSALLQTVTLTILHDLTQAPLSLLQWQEEKRERKWCWRCRGSSCNDDDVVEIDNCDSGDDRQRWVYKDASGDYVRISPKTRQDLCFERRSTNSFSLKSCDNNDNKQLFKGFKSNGDRFELTPHGQGDKILSQEHDPKSGEEIRNVKKSSARGDHTNYWQVYNRSGSGPSEGGGDDDDDGDTPSINLKGSDYCSPSNECGLCEGDCDVSQFPSYLAKFGGVDRSKCSITTRLFSSI